MPLHGEIKEGGNTNIEAKRSERHRETEAC